MKLRVWVQTDKIGSECQATIDFDDAELAEMSDDEKERCFDEVAREAMFNMIEWGFEPCSK